MKITLENIQNDEIVGFYCQRDCCDCYEEFSNYDENTGQYYKGGCNTGNIKDCPVFEELLNEETHSAENGWGGCEFCKYAETDEESDEFANTCGNCCHSTTEKIEAPKFLGIFPKLNDNADGSMFELDFEK